ncbi:hypothetical protein [Pseudobacteriovorax antillogorgiicola]|uniref:Lipoprotein n=1 Tax=Pseudobacteriovorax antillogorgiicola TaxID=1513793 RepID=A0A1Y6CJL8_9BACT|nr:hypothetical protein [Pseudobacteriovorax antillogorgiicola]TCS46417.1 hypothetical protein EDD56_12481 [Pseudobacteriovorax antillogorgiicola]SMF68969.1 hypothetical protein SAMN06296036_12481 [Pseudobacteriovorax antillogorgiicola]
MKLLCMLVGIGLVSCASSDDPKYVYGWCYQPLYWPSDCVEPEMPSKEEMAKWRREKYRRSLED